MSAQRCECGAPMVCVRLLILWTGVAVVLGLLVWSTR